MRHDAGSAGPFRCVVDRDFVSGITTLAIAGRLSGGNAAVAHFALKRCLADQPLAVVVDLDGVSPTMDVTCAALFSGRRWSDRPPAALLVHAPQDTIIGWLVRARHAHEVPVYDTWIDAVAAACAAKSSRRLHLYLAPHSHAAAAARNCVMDACRSWDIAPVADDAALIASELVTNAVVHAGSELDLTAVLHDGQLRLIVRDRSPWRPRMRPPTNDAGDRLAIRGRGLRLVDGLAAACGVVAYPDGKTVWARLRVGTPDRCAQDFAS